MESREDSRTRLITNGQERRIGLKNGKEDRKKTFASELFVVVQKVRFGGENLPKQIVKVSCVPRSPSLEVTKDEPPQQQQ